MPNYTGGYTAVKPGFRFPNLDELRFIAAMMVCIRHVEGMKSNFKLSNNYASNHSYLVLGKLGVDRFFVLSGLLVTFLLLKEGSENNILMCKKNLPLHFNFANEFSIYALVFLLNTCICCVILFL